MNGVEIEVINGNCKSILQELPEKVFHTCVTSPPYYGLRDYGTDEQIGLEETPDSYIADLLSVFREVNRVLRDDGTLWLNIGDTYAANRTYQVASTMDKGSKHSEGRAVKGKGSKVPEGLKPKDMLMIPARTAMALQQDGWYLRSQIIWSKPNVAPESVRDRPTNAYEFMFLFSKKRKYYYDADAVREPAVNGGTRNLRNVWTIPTAPYKGSHVAPFPPDLIIPCITAGSPEGGWVLDPFGGSGTTGLVSKQLGRNAVLIEINPEYAEAARERIVVG